jgi:aryl-alcohol dehydrogenase-like predicted oxidoreductase
MNPVPFGRTGLIVSRLSFGSVYFGPMGEAQTPEAAADVLQAALELGVNTWDTSDDYGTHPHIAAALKRVPRERVVVSSKITGFQNTLDHVLEELGTDYLDILLAHCVFLKEAEAWHERIASWQQEKARGRARLIGLSTHSAEVATLAAGWLEVDALLLPVNSHGVITLEEKIQDGGGPEMLQAAEMACTHGKGLLAMKVMGGGTLAKDPAASMRYVARLPFFHTLCIGMRNLAQVEQNLRLLQESGG